jgi:nucleoid-associated protein YgaU
VRLDDTPEARAAGLTTYLLAEALRQYQAAGYAQFEAQAMANDKVLRGIFAELGMTEYDEGTLWKKVG